MDPNNLLCMAWKRRHGDVTKQTNGDLAAALGRIKAKTLRARHGPLRHVRDLRGRIRRRSTPEQARAEAGAPAGAKR
jgi:hypothetical protein